MKKLIAIILVALHIAYPVLSFAPTYEEKLWWDYLEYEEQFYKDRDAGLFN